MVDAVTVINNNTVVVEVPGADAAAAIAVALTNEARQDVIDIYDEILAIEASGDDAAAIAARARRDQNLSDLTDAAAARSNIGADESANVIFLQTGTDAIERSVRSRLLDSVSVFDFDGVVGDGANDDAPGLRAAIAASSGKRLVWPKPPVRYRCESSLGEIAYTHFDGDGMRYVQVEKAYSGDALITLLDSAKITGLEFDGNGETETGDLIFIPDGFGNQVMRDVSLINGDTSCIRFEKDGGSRFTGDNIQASCWDTNNPAILIEDFDTGGTPRSFNRLETDGKKSFSTGGANNLYVSNSSLFDIDFSENNHDVTIVNCRLAGTTGYVLKGSGSIIGGAVGPDVTIDPDSVWTVIPSYTNNEIFDNSGGTSIVVQHKIQTYTPILKAGGTAITLGTGGSYQGRYSRSGKLVNVKMRVIWGTGATIPAGQLSITLPIPTAADLLQQCVHGMIQPTNGVKYQVMGAIPASGTEAFLEVHTTGNLTNASPTTLGNGTGLWLAFSYET